MTGPGDFDRSPGAALPHRSFTEPAVGALCSMIGWATDGTADKAPIRRTCILSVFQSATRVGEHFELDLFSKSK